MILNDHAIIQLAQAGMIAPFEPFQVRTVEDRRVLSYGPSSYGYDMRAGYLWRIFTPHPDVPFLDPKAPDPRLFVEHEGNPIIPAGGYALTHSLEHFRIPSDVLVLVVGKSTLARCGIIVNVTPGEPGWEGHWTIEVSNPTPIPVRMYAGEGIAQCLFFRGDAPPLVTYADKAGKYQGQTGITLPRM